MEDDNKTNAELLEEVKKLRGLTEKENAEKKSIRTWDAWGFIIGAIILIVVLFYACSR